MSFRDPFDAGSTLRMPSCSRGAHASQAEHDKDAALSGDGRIARVVESAVVRALIPQDQARRAFLRAEGASTALAAIAQFFPLGTAIDAFAQAAAPACRGDSRATLA